MRTALETATFIEAIIKGRGLTVKGVLSECGLAGTTVANMKSGSMPSADKLALLGQRLDLCTDYLLGREVPSFDGSINVSGGTNGVVGQSNAPVTVNGGVTLGGEETKEMGTNATERIFFLMEKNSIKPSQLTKEINLTNGVITQWKQGKQKPSIDALVKIADYFNVSLDYLVGRNSPTLNGSINVTGGTNGIVGQSNAPVTVNGDTMLSKEETDLLRVFTSLSAKERHKIMGLVYELEENTCKKN